ncbi:hypothetical protein (mitochondrion) [Glycine soja]|uniref:Uncharacterized protein n=3 Tax=Phaseoleae TaxID=163735 RepID=M1FPB2_SOYBN|nr:hypothetical protein I638_mgp026 [Glycine max]YP_009532856.1 hypothetical protein [Glycine soja]AFR34370.1 hypothetical protein GlmaxMp65 [Glycine max]AYD73004.1 hypothetical protein [Glycine soja]UBY46652.1 hypothetical protein [Glycine max]UBY46654.1 hypothetical protein [Glycine max]|eukprot:YP_007516914.1 hypothetical protein GlmaxMp65 (mitochondrion) [Glycine max]
MLGKKRICHSYSPVMSSLTYDSILVFAAHGSERPNLYIMSTSPLSFLVVGVGQDFTCKWIGFRCEIRLITTACEQLDSCFPGYSTDCAKDSSLLLKNHTISQGKAASSNLAISKQILISGRQIELLQIEQIDWCRL